MRRLAFLMIAVALAATGCASKAKTKTTTAARSTSTPAPTPAAPPVRASGIDVTGQWAGKWIGYGIVDIPRNEDATADLVQRGSHGFGRIILDGTGAAEAVPLSLRRAGLTGARVQFDISGRNLTMTHELGGQHFTIDFKIEGDRLVGRVRDTETPLRVVLERVMPAVQAKAPAAVAQRPTPAPPVAPAPPAEPEQPTTPEPPKQEPQVAMAPPLAAEPPPPAEAERPTPKDFVTVPEVSAVHFDFDQSQIRPAEARILDANADWLRNNPDLQVLIQGHCDERGTAEYNLALGERRARAARDYLVTRGIAADRISMVSFGEERPVCAEQTEACWARNRRTEFLIKTK